MEFVFLNKGNVIMRLTQKNYMFKKVYKIQRFIDI